jgi:hypothetical protein
LTNLTKEKHPSQIVLAPEGSQATFLFNELFEAFLCHCAGKHRKRKKYKTQEQR